MYQWRVKQVGIGSRDNAVIRQHMKQRSAELRSGRSGMGTWIPGAYAVAVIGLWALLALAILGYNALHYTLYLHSLASIAWRFVLPALVAATLAELGRDRLETRLPPRHTTNA